MDDLRHRAPAVWSSVRSHPSVRAATDRAAGWTGTDRLRAVTRTAATARTALAALSGNRGGADSRPLADVVPLRPRPGRRGDTSGGHLAVVIDLADHRARRRRFEPGSA